MNRMGSGRPLRKTKKINLHINVFVPHKESQQLNKISFRLQTVVGCYELETYFINKTEDIVWSCFANTLFAAGYFFSKIGSVRS